ncbi:hypothetical protein [Lewinella sp. LCG006]|uniref:hypothetical protein n=1 Tax=Lewinella sp. LCG006 TaxID=3231911 RepID=UPI003461084A
MVENKVDEFSGFKTDFYEIKRFLEGYDSYLKNYLSSLLRDTAKLALVAKQSYLHSNYFDKIVLYKSPINNFSLRLHIWDDFNYPEFKSDIHNHRWDFCSVVLKGVIEETVYSKILDEGDLIEMDFSTSKNSTRKYKRKNNATLIPRYKTRLEQGMCYTKFSDELHDVVSLSSYSATLMLRMDDEKDYSSIFLKSNQNLANREGPKSFFNVEELRLKIIKLLKNI